MDSTLPVEEGGPPELGENGWSIVWGFPFEGAFRTELRTGRTLLGRDETCDVLLPGRQVSRRHAAVVVDEQGVQLQDLGSRNGTHIEGVRVGVGRIKENALIRVGEWLGVLVRRGAVDAPEVVLADGYAGPVLRSALRDVHRAAKSDLPIILQGPTGSGKERAARALHHWSGRAGRFLAVNCSAVPEQLAEAEFFGYRRGAFTGAEVASVGHVRAAELGTLLLDEIADLPLPLQAKLLRVIEEQEVQGLGEPRPTSIDVRIVVATQVPLEELVASGRFRADLYGRLNGITAVLPALSQRRCEIPALLHHLMDARSGGAPPRLDPSLVERVCLYAWPGNVRELELLVRRLLGLHGHEPIIRVEHLAGTAVLSEAAPPPNTVSPAPPDGRGRDERELELLVAGLTQYSGNIAKAADSARISRQRAYRLLQARPELDIGSFRKETSQ